MARIRSIKPGFFTNDQLAEVDPLGRILFAGLWCHADRAGRLEDRPRKIKAEVLPYDDCDVDGLLSTLAASGFIVRYEVAGVRLIQVVNFEKHQTPNIKEIASTLPPPPRNDTPDASAQCWHSAGTVPALHLTVLEQEQILEQEQEHMAAADAPRHEPAQPRPLRPAPKPKDEAPKQRPPDPLFEAVCAVCGIDHRQLTDSERGKVNAATGQIRKAGGKPEEIPVRGANYRRHFTTTLTPMALAGNWGVCARPPDPPPERVRAAHTNGFNSDDAFASNLARMERMRREANR
jgi:hypothetical protein